MAKGDVMPQLSFEITHFREMLDQDWKDKVEHIYREVNLLADYLAGLGHDMSFCVHFIFFLTLCYPIIFCMICLGFLRLVEVVF
ncbi:hypothetical protein LINPERPRIM_LOCUS8523 [Linum perenne]